MWGQSNRFFEELKQLVNKIKKPTLKELDNLITLFENCMQSNILTSSYQKLLQLLVEVFLTSISMLPHQGLYRCFKNFIECETKQNKTQKSYMVVDCVIKAAARVSQEFSDKDLRLILGLVKKAGERYLGTEVLNVAIEYYLQNIEMMAEDKNNPSKQVMEMCSMLFGILFHRNKSYMPDRIKKYLGTNRHTTLLLLYQFQLLHNLLTDEQIASQFIYPETFITNKNLHNHCLQLFTKNFIFTIKQSIYMVLPYLYSIYPFSKLQIPKKMTQEELSYNMLLLQIFKNRQVMEKYCINYEINQQEKEELTYFWFNRELAGDDYLRNMRIWLKFITVYSFLLGNHLYPHEIFPMVDIISNYCYKQRVLQEECYRIYLDCLVMIHKKCGELKWEQFRQKQVRCKNTQNKEMSLKLQKSENAYSEYLKISEQWKEYFERMLEKNEREVMGEDESDQMILQKCLKLHQKSSHNWKILLSVMVQYLPRTSSRSSKPEIPLNNLAQTGLKFFQIRPQCVQNHFKAQKKISLFKNTPLTEQCDRLLRKLITQKPEIPLQEIVSSLRRFFSREYSTVNSQIIQNLSDNTFFISCLLLANNSSKIRTLAETLLQKISTLPSQTSKEELLKIFPIRQHKQQQIIIDYVKFLADRDKNRFKLSLYQKNLQEFEWLISHNLSNFVKDNKNTDNI